MSTALRMLLDKLPASIAEASRRIEPVVRQTYLQHSPFYSERTGCNVFLKCENLQKTGSFKLRGAANKFLSIPDPNRSLIVAASTGNYGKAVAYVVKQYRASCKIFSPTNTSASKLDAIRRLGADVVLSGDDCVMSEAAARIFAEEHSAPYLFPYNDPIVVAGQGTIGHELCQQLDRIDAVFASVGGGGMLSGLAAAACCRGWRRQFEHDLQIASSLPAHQRIPAL